MILGPNIINDYVVYSTKDKIIDEKDFDKLEDIDCILVLGAGAWGNSPSPLLGDRLDKGIELYEKNVAPKITAIYKIHPKNSLNGLFSFCSFNSLSFSFLNFLILYSKRYLRAI